MPEAKIASALPGDAAHEGSSQAQIVACDHCGTRVDIRAAIVDDGSVWCCDGCAAAARVIRLAGLQDYYRRRDALPARDGGRNTDAAAFDDAQFVARVVRPLPDGQATAELQVDGLSCAACTWLVERAVAQVPGVSDCHVSYGTGRATITFSPDTTPLSKIAARIAQIGYRPRAAAEGARLDPDLLARVGVATFASMNIMLLAVAAYVARDSGGLPEPWRSLFVWAQVALATPTVFYSSKPFFQRAWQGLQQRVLHMDLPIAAAIAILYGHGMVAVFTDTEPYLDSMTMLIALLLFGRLAEEVGRTRTQDAEAALLARAPDRSRVLRDGQPVEVSTRDIVPGDLVVASPGGALPVDGIWHSGDARLDASLITGESEPLTVTVGQSLWAGTVVLQGQGILEATAPASGSLLQRMAERVSAAANTRPPEFDWTDRLAPQFAAGTLIIAAAVFLGWGLTQGWAVALHPTIAVLVVACPCALSVGTSAAYAAGMGAAARRGAWIRDPEALLRLARTDVAVIDKTGTLTEGRALALASDDETLRLAAGAERMSDHPIARAILDACTRRGIPIPFGQEFSEVAGVGVQARIDGHVVRVSRGEPGRLRVMRDDQEVGWIELLDRLRPDTVRTLQALNMPVRLCTGDDATVAARIAHEAGDMPFEAQQSPEDKADTVQALQRNGHRVLFIGDGWNDLAALASAHAGVAMATGAAAGVHRADAVIVQDAFAPAAAAVGAARATVAALHAVRRVGLFYNVAAVAAAAAGWVDPLVAAILMPLSSASVILAARSVERRMRHADSTAVDPAVGLSGRGLRVALHPRSA